METPEVIANDPILSPDEKSILSNTQIIAAATNNPALAPDEVQLGDRKFKVLDLEYDPYLEFTSHLEPLLKSLTGLVTQRAGVSIPGLESDLSGIDASFLMKFCKSALPEMAVVVCNMQAIAEGRTADLVDATWVKKNARNPMVLASVVMKQITKNNIIMDFLDFFVQMLPTVMSLNRIKSKLTT